MVRRTESIFRGFDGLELFCQSWIPDGSQGTLIIVHGLGEHSECYQRLVNGLNIPWTIVGWDLRGHGRSEGKRGVVGQFGDFIRDLKCLLDHVQTLQPKPEGPMVLLGHSMGGLIVLKFLLDYGSSGLSAVCLSSPLLTIKMEIPEFKKRVANFLAQYLPKVTLANDINYSELSRDPAIVASYEQDALRQDRVCAALYLGMVETMKEVVKNGGKVQLPLLLQIAGDDKIVSHEVAEEFYETIGSKKKKKIVYPESYHELFNDLNREEVYRDLAKFLDQFLVAKASSESTLGAGSVEGGPKR